MQLRLEANFDSWKRAIASAQENARALTPARRAAGEVLLDRVRANFTESGGPIDWEPLAPSTLLSRGRGASGKGVRGSKGFAKRIADAKPLIFTGKLFRSLAYALDVDGSIVVGSPLIQAARLFFGWDGPGPKTPARNPFHLRPRDLEKIARGFISHIFQGWR